MLQDRGSTNGTFYLETELNTRADGSTIRECPQFEPNCSFPQPTFRFKEAEQEAAIANQRRTVRVPAHLHDKMLKVRSAAAAFEQRKGRAPSMDELVRDTELPESTVRRALDASRSALSLDAPIAAAESTTFGELTPDRSLRDAHEPVFEDELSRKLESLLSELPPREAMILRLRHGLGGTESHTLEEIGALLSITRERTRQLQNRALKSLKERLDPRLAEAFAE